ncbi:hypothetical protein [Nitrosomonas ureae]|nr:hypothetical protein [Nitrosomonas ureae]
MVKTPYKNTLRSDGQIKHASATLLRKFIHKFMGRKSIASLAICCGAVLQNLRSHFPHQDLPN